MKKILWLIILIPIFMTTAWASETYYSDYTNFSDYQEQKVEKTDTINVEEVTMYKWYKEVKKIGGYELYNSSDKFTTDCYETKYSDWSKTKPQITEATILDERTIYDYQMIKPIRYIHLYNLDGSYSAFRITELQVLNDNTEIDYTYTCKGCWQDFDKYIHNGIYAENMSIIDDGGYLIIDLGKEYPIDKINLILYLFDMGNEDKKYTIGFSNDSNNIIFNKSYTQKFELYYAKDSIKYEYSLKDFNVDNSLWLYQLNSEQYLDTDFVYNRTSYKEYRYKEKMCKTYTLSKEYYPQYSINSVGEYKLKESPKTFYRYQTRDKLQLNTYDITEKNYDLNNFVIFNSDKYTINHNINWDKNGVYNVTFNLNDINVTKNVKVNILSNAIVEKEEEIANLKDQLNNTVEDYKKIIEELEKSNIEYLNSINNLNAEIIDLNKKIENINIQNNQQTEEINDLTETLELKINQQNEKIIELEEINKIYLENLNQMLKDILVMEEKFNGLDTDNQNQKDEISDLKIKFNNLIEEYNLKIQYLESFNNECIVKFEQINSNIENINTYLQNLEQKVDDNNEQLNEKIEEANNSIIEVKNVLSKQLEDLLKISLEIKNIQQQIENSDSNNKILYEKLAIEFENSKIEMNQNITNLLIQIENIESEISNLNNSSNINEEQVKKLQDKLEQTIKNYQLEIEKLNEFNKIYLNKVQVLNGEVEELNKKIDIMDKNENENNLDIQNIKQQIAGYKEQYNKIVNDLNSYNEYYLNELKNIQIKFKDISSNMLNFETTNNEKIDELNNLINQNNLLLKNIGEINSEKYNQITQEQNDMNNKFTVYEEELKILNEEYTSLIELLKNEIQKILSEIQTIKQNNSNDYKKLLNYQNLIYEQLMINNDEIIAIKEKQVMDNENLENLKNEILYVSSKLDDTKEVQQTDLNSKLNNYMLRINGVELVNLLWFYIIMAIIFGIYLIYTFKKSRIKK